jgi:hypothetical protein
MHQRQGDASQLAILEWVDITAVTPAPAEEKPAAETKPAEAPAEEKAEKKAKGKGRKKKAEGEEAKA